MSERIDYPSVAATEQQSSPSIGAQNFQEEVRGILRDAQSGEELNQKLLGRVAVGIGMLRTNFDGAEALAQELQAEYEEVLNGTTADAEEVEAM